MNDDDDDGDGGGGKLKSIGMMDEFQPDDENLHGGGDGDAGDNCGTGEDGDATEDGFKPIIDWSIITVVSIGL
jgi:hypothetical protein